MLGRLCSRVMGSLEWTLGVLVLVFASRPTHRCAVQLSFYRRVWRCGFTVACLADLGLAVRRVAQKSGLLYLTLDPAPVFRRVRAWLLLLISVSTCVTSAGIDYRHSFWLPPDANPAMRVGRK